MSKNNGILITTNSREPESKYWIRTMYKDMIKRYSKCKQGIKTEFGATITPLFMDTLKKRHSQLCTSGIWV